MTNKELVAKCIDIAENYKTLYVMGCFGAPLTGANVSRYCKNHEYNRAADRTRMIQAAANQSPPVFGFDCVNLIKGILWGWSGDASRTYGGAVYPTASAINAGACPDIGADGMIAKCKAVSTTGWDKMMVGEAVWMSGHIGVYIGDGLAVECTPRWKNCVQITAVANIGAKSGYNARKWTKHGKIPYITYEAGSDVSTGSQGNSGASTETTTGIKVGDVVEFTGTKHFVSSNAINGKSCKPGKAKVTQIANGGKHPYHLVKSTGSTSTVYGWVDAADVKAGASVQKGASVKVKKGAKTYTGGSLASFVYSNTYTVMQVDGDRAVIGQNGAVTAAVKVSDLIIQ